MLVGELLLLDGWPGHPPRSAGGARLYGTVHHLWRAVLSLLVVLMRGIATGSNNTINRAIDGQSWRYAWRIPAVALALTDQPLEVWASRLANAEKPRRQERRVWARRSCLASGAL